MKALRLLCSNSGPALAVLFLAGLVAGSVMAYPPAPHHTIYGIVRDEMGNPLVVTDAEVLMDTLTGVRLKSTVTPGLKPDANYRLQVPMDAGLTADTYKPTALRPTVAFRLKVKIGTVTYLPLEVAANYSSLGKPAQSTRVDLTLGEDLDGDGLPDAWERAVISSLGAEITLQDIRPDGDADNDGLSNLQEYLAGTYAFDPQDGFRLDAVDAVKGHLVLEFLAIRGRSYVLESSQDLKNWVPARFRLTTDPPGVLGRDFYQATDVRLQRVEALQPDGEVAPRLFYRAKIQ